MQIEVGGEFILKYYPPDPKIARILLDKPLRRGTLGGTPVRGAERGVGVFQQILFLKCDDYRAAELSHLLVFSNKVFDPFVLIKFTP